MCYPSKKKCRERGVALPGLEAAPVAPVAAWADAMDAWQRQRQIPVGCG